MNTTTKLYGTTYTVETVNGYPDELLLTGPRGAGYLLQPITNRPGVFILNSITSGEKRVKGNRAYVALVAGEIVEAGLGRIDADVAAAAAQVEPVADELAELDEVAEDTEVLTDAELADLNAQGAELEAVELDSAGQALAAEAEAHLAASWALGELKSQTLEWVRAGMDPEGAYGMATRDMVARDRRAALALAFYTQAGRLSELDG